MNVRRPFIVAAITLLSLHTSVQAPREQDDSVVKGIITDVSGARVSDAWVHFAGEGHYFSVRATMDGTYTIQLAAGTYRVSVTSPGFCAQKRAAFSLKSNSEVEFDFELVDCATVDYITLEPFEGPPSQPPINPDQYQEEELNPVTPDGLRPLVLFGKRQGSDDSIRYSGLSHREKQLQVIYTYNLMTIKADNLVYSPKNNSIEGAGHVAWQDGKDTRSGARIEVSFRDGLPQVSLTDQPSPGLGQIPWK